MSEKQNRKYYEPNPNVFVWKESYDKVLAENKELKKQIEELKNQPDPLTAYLYAAELAKDKMKEMKEEILTLRKKLKKKSK